jgi:hypothetical protein
VVRHGALDHGDAGERRHVHLHAGPGLRRRHEGVRLAEAAGVRQPNDTNYIFPAFVPRCLPAGILGLVLAMILGSLVEAVNLLGSFFYGGMLGVFVLAVAFPRVRGRGAFWGVVCGEAVIFGCWCFTGIVFLWYNVIGCAAVVLTGLIVTAVAPGGTGESHVGDDERYFTGATLADQGGT